MSDFRISVTIRKLNVTYSVSASGIETRRRPFDFEFFSLGDVVAFQQVRHKVRDSSSVGLIYRHILLRCEDIVLRLTVCFFTTSYDLSVMSNKVLRHSSACLWKVAQGNHFGKKRTLCIRCQSYLSRGALNEKLLTGRDKIHQEVTRRQKDTELIRLSKRNE